MAFGKNANFLSLGSNINFMGNYAYIEDKEFDDGGPYLVEEGNGGFKYSKPVEKFFKLLEIEKMSLEEAADITGFRKKSVEKAQEFYAEHYEEFDEKVDSENEFEVAEDAKLSVPDEGFDEIVDRLEGPYHRGCEILRDAPTQNTEKSRDLSIDKIKTVDNGLKAVMQEKNGVEGSIIVSLKHDSVEISYEFYDGEQNCNDQISAYGSLGVEMALDISFGQYAGLVHDNL